MQRTVGQQRTPNALLAQLKNYANLNGIFIDNFHLNADQMFIVELKLKLCINYCKKTISERVQQRERER